MAGITENPEFPSLGRLLWVINSLDFQFPSRDILLKCLHLELALRKYKDILRC